MPTPATRTLNPLPFDALEPKRFEDLIRQLAYDFRRWRKLEATGRAGGDDGFDARGWEIADLADSAEEADDDSEPDRLPTASDRIWLIQCKREAHIGPAKLISYLNVISEDERKGLYGIIIAAPTNFSKRAQDAFSEWCSKHGISER